MITHLGSCHCKLIQFEVTGKNNIQVLDCSCSICSIVNYKHYVVDKSQHIFFLPEQVVMRKQSKKRNLV